MCGICAIISTGGPVLDLVLNCLAKLEYRGYDSAGLGFHDKSGTNRTIKATGAIDNLRSELTKHHNLYDEDSPCIGHTRWSTHGVPSVENCHPHSSFGGMITLCHNGIIDNYMEIQNNLRAMAIEMTSETDSESISHFLEQCISAEMLCEPVISDVAELSDERVVLAITRALRALEGSFAIVFMIHGENNRVFAAKRDSPMVIGQDDDHIFIASDYPAFLEYTNQVSILEDNDVVVARSDGTYNIWHDSYYDKQPEHQSDNVPLTPPVDGESFKSLSPVHTGASWEANKNSEFFDVLPYLVTRSSQKMSTNIGNEMIARGTEDIMLSEIMQQPKVIDLCLHNRYSFDQSGNLNIKLKELSSIHDDDSYSGWNPNRLVFIACGTSLHASIWASSIFRAAGNPRIDLCIASEFQHNPHLMPEINENVTYFFVSQSGETSDTLKVLRTVKDWRNTAGRAGEHVRLLGVCNAVGSAIARESDTCVYTRAGPEIAVASTKAMVSQMITLALIASQLWDNARELPATSMISPVSSPSPKFRGIDNRPALMMNFRDLRGRGVVESSLLGMLRLKDHMEPTLKTLDEYASKISSLDWMYNATSCFFIGRGKEFCLAQEGALKLKEISYIHAEAMPSGELKHGTLALIEESIPSIVLLCSSNPTIRHQIVASIREIKARSGKVIVVCLDDSFADELEDTVEFMVRIPVITGESTSQSVVELVFLQLMAYRVAKKLGRNVDKPRNLAKSVTVG